MRQMGKPLDYNATLVERIDLTDKLSLFRVKPDAAWGPTGDGRIPDYDPGQYVTLGMNNIAQPEKGSVQRAYSIASPPEEKRWFEFYIRYVDHPASDNPLTHLLWPLKQGERLFLGKKVVGHFTLEKAIQPDDARLRVTVAAGTGLAPFLSMVLSARNRGKDIHRFAMLHGASYAADLGYADELKALYRERPDLYFPSISRPQSCPGWNGPCGRIESHFSEPQKLATLETRLGLGAGGMTPERAVIFICGLTGTIQNIVLAMLKRGFVPSDRALRKALGLLDLEPSLFYEQYDSEPVIDVATPEAVAAALEGTPFADRAAPTH
jgi:ferredoxin--NADP+ reductase